MPGNSYCDASCPDACEGGEVIGAKLALSHGFLAMFKWTMCRYRETVCLPEAWRETDVAPSEDE
jgi:hypothetical protein